MSGPDDMRVELLALDERGGQRVGTGRFLIRVTHIPTGMSVTVIDRRGQHTARNYAITMIEMMVEDLT